MFPIKNTPIFLIIVLWSSLVWSQNLVKNPSFEEYNQCPEEFGNLVTDIKGWSGATEGTTDYFNSCSTAMNVPKNFIGEQETDFGKAYVGLYLLAPNDYREYLQAELVQQLIKGERYKISFYLSLADKSTLSVRDIGILFSENKINEPTRKHISNTIFKSKNNTFNYTEMSRRDNFSDKLGWSKVEFEIVANGTENYLTLGNFRNNTATKQLRHRGNKPAAYYYVDMVSVTPVFQNPFRRPLVNDKIYVLKNIIFKTREYALDTASKEELKLLYGNIKDDASLFVEINAHTDTDGSPSYNELLSSKRAISVANYLVTLGLPKERLSWKGYGGKLPVAKNESTEGKQKNRRVEFMLSRKRQLGTASNTFEDE